MLESQQGMISYIVYIYTLVFIAQKFWQGRLWQMKLIYSLI